MNSISKNWLYTGVLATLTLLADFASKSWANANLCYGQSLPFITGLLRFTLTKNTGSAFGIGRENAPLMTLLSSAIFLSILFWLIRKENSDNPPSLLERTGLAFVLGGAAGNLLDRFSRGEVTDFLEFTFISFPVFNCADMMIDVGAALIIIATLTARPAQTVWIKK